MIKKLYHRLQSIIFKSEFRRNVMTLATGTTIASSLPVAVVPILTRVFTPEDFGILAFYSAVVTIFAILSTAGYELAIVLPKKRDDAYQILILSCTISTFFSLLLLFVIWFFEKQIAGLLNNPENYIFLYWMPLSVFLISIYQSLYYWFNREKAYRNMANSGVIKNSTIVISQISFGFLTKLSALGLIMGQLIGQILGTIYMVRKFIKGTQDKHKPKISKQFTLAKRYINFPKFILVANTMNATSRQLPSIFFNIFFTQTAAGFYLIVNLAIGVPITIFSIAIGDVFRQQASVAYAERGECLKEYKKIFKKLLMISLLPFGLFALIAPDLFEIVFGKNWRIAGEYAQILTPMFLLRFISNPLSNMFLIAEKQKLELLLQTILLLATGLCFVTGLMFEDIVLTICLISAINTLMYAIMALMSLKFAKGIVK